MLVKVHNWFYEMLQLIWALISRTILLFPVILWFEIICWGERIHFLYAYAHFLSFHIFKLSFSMLIAEAIFKTIPLIIVAYNKTSIFSFSLLSPSLLSRYKKSISPKILECCCINWSHWGLNRPIVLLESPFWSFVFFGFLW